MKHSKIIMCSLFLLMMSVIASAQSKALVETGPRVLEAMKDLAETMERTITKSNLGYVPYTTDSYKLAEVLRLPEVPAIGESRLYAQKVRLGQKLETKVSSKMLERLLATHVIETSFPGYMADCNKEYKQAVAVGFGPNEWKQILSTYEEGTRFYPLFVRSWKEIVTLQITAYDYPEREWLSTLEPVVDHMVNDVTYNKSGFVIVLKMRTNRFNMMQFDEKDVLILDLKGRRFISLNQVKALAKRLKQLNQHTQDK